MLYYSLFGLRGDPLCLLDGRLVTADKDNWHCIMRSHQRIDTRLAHHLPIDANLPDRARIIGMRENSAFSANRPMIADKADPSKLASSPCIMYRGLCLPVINVALPARSCW